MSPCPLILSTFGFSAIISVLAFVAGVVLSVNAFHSFYLTICNEIALPDYSRKILTPVTKDKQICCWLTSFERHCICHIGRLVLMLD